MGVFDKVFHSNRKKNMPTDENSTVSAPVGGEVIALENFPDPVISQKTLGLGCGILPAEEQITAPFDGKVIQVTGTKHAVGLKSVDGVEVLIHIGVDTVDMNGRTFSSDLRKGQSISKGDLLISFSRKAIRAAGHSDAVAVIVVNADDSLEVRDLIRGNVATGAPLLEIRKKAK